MNEDHADFKYEPLLEIAKEFRQVDWTLIESSEKPFSEGEEALHQLREDLEDRFTYSPFAHLHFLRAIEDRLLTLAVDKRQPIAVCLKYLRRRLDLEYCRCDLNIKAAHAVILARYAVECGDRELATTLLKEEQKHLRETVETCRPWLDTIAQEIEGLGNLGPDEE